MCIHQGKCIHTGIHQGKWPCLAGRNRFHRFLRLTASAVVQLELSKEGLILGLSIAFWGITVLLGPDGLLNIL